MSMKSEKSVNIEVTCKEQGEESTFLISVPFRSDKGFYDEQFREDALKQVRSKLMWMNANGRLRYVMGVGDDCEMPTSRSEWNFTVTLGERDVKRYEVALKIKEG